MVLTVMLVVTLCRISLKMERFLRKPISRRSKKRNQKIPVLLITDLWWFRDNNHWIRNISARSNRLSTSQGQNPTFFNGSDFRCPIFLISMDQNFLIGRVVWAEVQLLTLAILISPSSPTGKLIKHTAENTIRAKAEKTCGGQCWKNKRRPTSQKHAVANAENTARPHNEGRPLAAPHHMVVATFGGRHHVVSEGRPSLCGPAIFQYSQHWPPHVFGTLASACSFSIGLRMLFQLLSLLFFPAFAPIVLLGCLGPK